MTLIVEVEEGKLQGVEKKSILPNEKYYAFLGIPYAKPPVGELRFQAPVPSDKWNGVRDATKEGNVCVQMAGDKVVGSEDCLFLNVYTPEPPSSMKDKKAVMVYIHGGAFTNGSCSATFFGPDFLIGRDIILVILNYRLHVLGFLNTGTLSCPGNAGLKDQHLALKWTKRNIASFGGDSDNITLFGESAGAASVGLQTLSPLSKDLFHRAIIQSGGSLVPWATTQEYESRAQGFGKLAGYDGEDLEGLAPYLRNLTAENLCKLANQYDEENRKIAPGRCDSIMLIPSVEKIKVDAFLPDTPENLMELAPRIPLIIGYNNQEGSLLLTTQVSDTVDKIVADPSIALKRNFRLTETEQAELLAQIEEFYFENATPTRERVVELYTDLYYCKFFESIDYLVESNVPPRVYLFPYEGTFNFGMKQIREAYNLNATGAAHGDDMGYIFHTSSVNIEDATPADKEVISNFCTLWTDFAKYGNPVHSLSRINWKPHTNSQPCYMGIEDKLTVFNKKLYAERHDFWKKWTPNFVRSLQSPE